MNRCILILFLLPCFSVSAYEAEIIVSTKRAITQTMKDPDSVKFKDVFYNYTEVGKGVACGQFNAKNSFGAYVGFNRFISNGKTNFIEGDNDSKPPFPELWNMVCLKKH